MKLKGLIVVAAVVGLACPAAYAGDLGKNVIYDAPVENPGLYLTVYGGSNIIPDLGLTGQNGPWGGNPDRLMLNTKTGWTGGIGIGKVIGALPMGSTRFQVDGTYSKNTISTADVKNGSGSSFGISSGKIEQYAVMFNLLQDFDLGGNIIPYLGIGAGATHQEFDSNIQKSGTGIIPTQDAHWAFAAQGLAGVAIPYGDRLTFYTEYRYLTTFDKNLKGARGNIGIERLDVIDNHSIVIGVRIPLGR